MPSYRRISRMGRKTTKRIGSFTAESADGQQYKIHVFQDFHDVRTRGGTSQLEGHKTLKTTDGEHVNRIDKGHYEIVGISNIPLTSNDPKAE
jgi:hypothetical protein